MALFGAISGPFLGTPRPHAGKRVTIGPEAFSEIYPAVWFSPEDATFVALKERSEKPPDAQHRIWIEPSDPEINTLPLDGGKRTRPFVVIGSGSATYRTAARDAEGKRESRLRGATLLKDKPVFLYTENDRVWVCMILAADKEKQTMSFLWRELKAEG